MKSQNLNRIWTKALSVAFALGLIASSVQADVIYQQVFGNNTGSTWQTPTAAGTDWSLWLTVDNYAPAAFNSLGVSPLASLTTTDNNIGTATPTSAPSLTNGYISVANGTASYYTKSLSLDPTASQLQFSWYQKDSGNAGVDYNRLLVQVGGIWYVSATKFFSSGTTSVLTESLTYDPTAANWLRLSTGTNPWASNYLTLSTAAPADLSGNITGFGLVMYSSNASWMIADTFAVTTVPEPNSLALIASCAMGFALLRLRKRSCC